MAVDGIGPQSSCFYYYGPVFSTQLFLYEQCITLEVYRVIFLSELNCFWSQSPYSVYVTIVILYNNISPLTAFLHKL